MHCVRRGVPYDIAMRMSPARLLAHVVAIGEDEGGTFDFPTRTWQEPHP